MAEPSILRVFWTKKGVRIRERSPIAKTTTITTIIRGPTTNCSNQEIQQCRLYGSVIYVVMTTQGDLALARSLVIDVRRRVISLPSALQVSSLDLGVLVPGRIDSFKTCNSGWLFTRCLRVKLFQVASQYEVYQLMFFLTLEQIDPFYPHIFFKQHLYPSNNLTSTFKFDYPMIHHS